MQHSYRDKDYRVYAQSNNYCCITFGDLNTYKNARYGSGALAFYFPGFITGIGRTFQSTPQDAVNKLNRDFPDKEYIRGHIINSFLDGPTINDNLVPLTSQANRDHATVENRIKEIIGRMQSHGFSAHDVVLGYEIDVCVEDNVPIGIDINIDFFYLSDISGHLHIADYKRDFASDQLFNCSWGWSFPFSTFISNG